ncbi:MAG: SsrA-binding protein SmpB [Eubacteriales bacterium]|nr:SsrA-binding protein SmpB [Clostridiales bacterium]MDY5836905.1 SsrA-binding protein SmpB [Eubacteriales bacterium]
MKKEAVKILAQNRKARFSYEILESFEAGIVLTGTEVKSARQGRVNLQDAYAAVEKGEVFIKGMHISPYDQGNRFNPDPMRKRKLLLHKREIRKLAVSVQQEGLTLIPLRLYLKRGLIKLELSIAKGKKLYDKRESIKKRETERELTRNYR